MQKILKISLPDTISQKLNCFKKEPIDLSWRNINAFVIETGIQNGVVGYVFFRQWGFSRVRSKLES